MNYQIFTAPRNSNVAAIGEVSTSKAPSVNVHLVTLLHCECGLIVLQRKTSHVRYVVRGIVLLVAAPEMEIDHRVIARVVIAWSDEGVFAVPLVVVTQAVECVVMRVSAYPALARLYVMCEKEEESLKMEIHSW